MKKITFWLAIFWMVLGFSALGQTYPAQEVSRPLILPEGLFELRGWFSWFDTDKYFDDSSSPSSLEADQDWREFRALLELGYGVRDWWEVGGSLPYIMGKEFYAKAENIGDAEVYSWFRAYSSASQNLQLALGLGVSFPTGDNEREMTLENNKYYLKKLPTGNQLSDFWGGAKLWWREEKYAFRFQLNYRYCQEGEIDKGIESIEEKVKFKPGDSWRVSAEFLRQYSALVLILSGEYFSQQADLEEGESLDNLRNYFQAGVGLEYQLSPELDLFFKVSANLLGRNQPVALPVMFGLENRF